MSGFTAHLYERNDYNRERVFTHVTFAVEGDIEANWRGGPTQAHLRASGPASALSKLSQALNCGVRILAPDGVVVWTGMVHEVEVQTEHRTYPYSLDDIANRVQVDFMTLADDGLDSQYSDWAEDALSQEHYGVRELRVSASGEMTPAEAARRAAGELRARRYPKAHTAFTGGEPTATLYCVGLIRELDFFYYENTPGGRTEYDPGGEIEHPVGWEASDEQAGFSDNGENNTGAYSSFAGKLPPGPARTQFSVSGSALGNDGTYTIQARLADAVQTLDTATDGAHFKYDAGSGYSDQYLVEEQTNGLGFLKVGQQFHISITDDSTGKQNMATWSPDWEMEGYFNVREEGDERVRTDGRSIEWDQGDVHNHPPYLSGTLTAAAALSVSPRPAADELRDDGDTYTVKTLGWRVAQQVNIPSGGGGALWKVAVPVAIVGTPVDTFRISVWTDNGAGGFGSLIDEGWLTTSDVTTELTMRWCEMDEAGQHEITDSSAIHIVAERTGATDDENYWVLGIIEGPDPDGDEESDLYEEEARFWNGSTWVARTWGASLPFRVWTGVDISEKIKTVIDAVRVRIAGVEALDLAGVLTSPYEDGERKASDIVQDLLKNAFDDGRAVGLRMVPERRLVIFRAPESTDRQRYVIGLDGNLRLAAGGPVAPGLLPVGEWVEDMAAPSPPPTAIEGVSPVFLDTVAYNVEHGAYTTLGTDESLSLGYRDG